MLKHTLTIYLIVVLGLLQAACGGGGRSGGSGTASSQDTRIVSIKITPGSVMLTQVGEQRALQAQAYNAAGEEVDATFSWSSSHPDQVAIDVNGMLTAQTLGSAEIKATANGVTSEPALVLMTLPVANARLVADEQIVGDFTPVDSAAPYGLGFQYTVTLRGIDLPQVGEVLLGTGEAPLGGRVAAAKQVGRDVTVTLEIIPLSEMFDKLALDETIDLNAAPISIPQEVAVYYDVEIKPDGSLQFTLKPDAPAIGQTQSKASPGAQVAAKVTRRIGPLDCEFETGPFFSLNALSPTITIERDLSLPLVYDPDTEELRKISLKGRVKTEFKVTNTLTAQFESKGTCKREMYRISIPINGPLALLFGGQIPVGFGFEVGGKATFAGAGFTLSAVSEFTAEVGMSCPASSPCEMIQTGEVTGQTTASWTLPDGLNPDTQLRFEPALYGFAFATLSLGPSSTVMATERVLRQILPVINVFSALSIDAFEVTAGLTLGANLAPVEGQILDPAYASDYKLTQDIKAGPSQDIDSILGMIGVNLVKAEYTSSLILTTSPKALVSGVTADVSTFNPGDIVNFKVRLDPTTVNFGIYNVDEVRIYRKVNTGGVINEVLVATALADDAQTEFDLSWVATEASAIGGDFFAFVTTKMLPIELFGTLELEPVAVSGRGKIAFVSDRDGNKEIYVMNADGANQVNLTENPQFDGDKVTWSPDRAKIAFVSDRNGDWEIYVMDADGSNQLNLTQSPQSVDYDPIWSPDSTKIAFTSNRDGRDNIFVMNADGSNQLNLTQSPQSIDRAPTWSPDSTKIAFESFRDLNGEIYVMNVDGSNPVNLSQNSGWDQLPVWSPDGEKIAFESNRDGNWEIYVMNVDGSNPVNLTQSSGWDRSPVWSPDATKIAFETDRDGKTQIYVMNVDGSSQRNLTQNLGYDNSPTWSPDGEKIAFESNRDGNPEIYVMNKDGSNPVNLTQNPGWDRDPNWSP